MHSFVRWDQTISTEATNALVKSLSLWCISNIRSTELRENLTTLVGSDDFPALCNYVVDYSRLNASDAYFLRQTLAFYSKRVDLDIGVDREGVARSTFIASEELCLETNTIFKAWGSGRFQFPPDVESYLFRAQRKIASVLGGVPSLGEIKARFGPGATTQLQKRTASARKKLGMGFACSEDLVPLLPEVLSEMPAWIPFGESDAAVVPVELHPGLLRFVPKSAKTDRAIVVEPMLNSMFQIGIGDYISRRLRTVGIDTRDQERNQILAWQGSVSGALATLDLSSASDTIARELVAHLLPVDWFFFLDRFRTGTIIEGENQWKLQKFSSMGNGFTFPLETLIFWALAASVCSKEEEENVSVFGDDIIIPSHRFAALTKLLVSCGFIPNLDKSFCSGPFRESCGKDYFSGILIRPVFLKDRLSGESAFTLHNFFVRRGFLDAASIVLSWIDPSLRVWGPDGYGDGHLLGDVPLTPHRRKDGWSGYTFETFSWVGRKDFRPYPGDYVFPSYSIYVGSDSETFDDALARYFVRGRAHPQTDSFRFDAFVKRFSVSGGGCTSFYRKGLLGSSIPGKSRYKRIKIYTLDPT